MQLLIKEYEVKDPKLGCLAIKIISATGLKSKKYIYIVNEHQIAMILEERHKYIIINLALLQNEIVVMTSNGLGFQKIPAKFVTQYLNSRRKIVSVNVVISTKGEYKIISARDKFSSSDVAKLLQLRDDHLSNFIKGKELRVLKPNEFINQNLKFLR